jgi:hypothetical protein
MLPSGTGFETPSRTFGAYQTLPVWRRPPNVPDGAVLRDPLAVTVFDADHSDDEERWFTLGSSATGRLLAVAHRYRSLGPDSASARIISAREATRTERRQYEQNPQR